MLHNREEMIDLLHIVKSYIIPSVTEQYRLDKLDYVELKKEFQRLEKRVQFLETQERHKFEATQNGRSI